jgi:xylose isomerase
MNDNWREWDDDMTVGAVHLAESLEFMQALRKVNWQGPILLDQFPFRENSIKAAQLSINTLKALDSMLDRLDLKALEAAQEKQDALQAQQIVLETFLGVSLSKE